MKSCTIAGCEDKFYGKGLCRSHYSRWWKYGDPLYTAAKRTKQSDYLCLVDRCDRNRVTAQMCRLHYERKKRGAPLDWQRTYSTNYRTVHTVLRQKYGPAPFCIWGEHKSPHYEWANVTGDYTRDLENYLPMCLSCHRKFDMTEEIRLAHADKLSEYRSKRRTPVEQYDTEGNLIAAFESKQSAAASIGVYASAIANAVSGRSKTAGGYIWRATRVES